MPTQKITMKTKPYIFHALIMYSMMHRERAPGSVMSQKHSASEGTTSGIILPIGNSMAGPAV
jgi:hypothetical protein